MKPILSAAILVFVLFTAVPNANAQIPSMLDLAKDVDRAASTITGKSESFLGFKKLEMPKLLDGFLDVRFKKPTLPSLGLLDKLKNIGQPQVAAPTTQGPILAGLSKLFPQQNTAPTPSLMDRLLGKSSAPSASASSLFSAQDMSDLTNATKGLQDQVGRMSQGVRSNATDLFSGQNNLVTPQPPLRTARQYSGQSESRY